MKMKIWYEFTMPGKGAEKAFDTLRANWKKVGRPDTELVIKAPTIGTNEFRYSVVGHMYADMLRTTEMVEGIMQAERDGYDGAVIGCFGDPGLDVLESLVHIPVTGPAKAALIFGQAVGNKMALVTLPNWEKKIEKLIKAYGAQDLVISNKPCRALTLSPDQFADEDSVLDNFMEIAKSAICDGADVISLGCTRCSPLLTSKGVLRVGDVPIVDGTLAALKLVEMMVDFKNAGLWKRGKTIEADIIEGLRGGYYHGSESI
jgi:allantoin racemase